ncbi:MAG TPA: AAA family ATPase [Candidatus Paceibacterota bacterium]|jgi:chromosome segregation protein|nr:AAA family ATPase [Candidatus Paceibacterota bacterium]
MRLQALELNGFKSFAKKTTLSFERPIVSIVGPNGSGKSNVVESIRFVLGEQSMKSMRGKSGTDLIFKGSKNLSRGSRASVTVYFDNSDKVFRLSNDAGEEVNLNYDTISISREVYPDGMNKYILNGSDVRLKDIHNLLSSVHIGASGHHIISQGEADRILNANPRERREMVEDALGLKIYQYKIRDAERKLERTEENMKEVSLLRREIAPHLRFLAGQVEKIEKGKSMREELAGQYALYFKAEGAYLASERAGLREEEAKIQKEVREIEEAIKKLPAEDSATGGEEEASLEKIEKRIFSLKSESGDLMRELGRVEGALESALKNRGDRNYSSADIERFFREARDTINAALDDDDVIAFRRALEEIQAMIDELEEGEESGADLSELEDAKAAIGDKLEEIKKEEKKLSDEIASARENLEKSRESRSLANARRYEFNIRKTELAAALAAVHGRGNALGQSEESLKNEEREAVAILGPLFKKDADVDAGNINKAEIKKDIERLKIKLEDYGSIGVGETMKEYEETEARDKFLEKEMTDLSQSIESLEQLIADLKEKIDSEFKDGVKKINKEFHEFFTLLFGGGSASLAVEAREKRKKAAAEEDEEEAAEDYEDDEEAEEGIEIDVSLPQKKVKELNALSGGERSLTSIALLFAMSQVNPPPFLVLDETDAALDEANSRKYGDMLEKLSKKSELIVVTHNRETMSRAGILYGVTIGSDGASKLLSVKFEEAAAIAK